MRPTSFSPRRVRLTSRRFTWVTAIAVLVAVLLPIPANAQVGTDDYPVRLKTAGQDDLVDPWNFYNRECTSFVAWRLNNDRDVAFHNYFLGVHWGNASNWGYAARKVGVPVDDEATVGSVAWWAAGTPGSSRGHVAWVLASSATEITIEEYNWVTAGRYSQRVIARTSAKWPSGFIHLNPPKMQASTKPSVVGTPQVGTPVMADPGVWTPSGATYTYQWFADGTAIAGATAAAFTPTPDMVGAVLHVRVRAVQPGVSATKALSEPSAAVVPGTFTTPTAPHVVGRPRVGEALAADPGTWSPTATYSYQWLAGGTPVPGATEPTFTPTPEQLDQKIKVDVTATAPGYNPATARSGATWRVLPGTITTATPTIVGNVQVNGQLSVSPGPWSPTAEYTYQWYADGNPLNRGDGPTYVPTRAQLGKRLTVTVSGTAEGYEPAAATSAPSVPVAPGELTTTEPPAVEGTPQVGETVTAAAGSWYPAATVSYQWMADGRSIDGATAPELALTPALAGRSLAVQVSAQRAGYRAASAVSTPLPVAKGVMQRLEDPTISTTAPRFGQPVQAFLGRWDRPEAVVSYQWLADGTVIPEATSARFVPGKAQLGLPLTLRVIARAPGYRADVTTFALGRVLRGETLLGSAPTLHGVPTLGRALTVRHGAPTPRSASVTYQWFRGQKAIPGAHSQSYRLQAADVGRFVWVKVRVRAENWLPTRHDSPLTPRVASRPVLATTTSLTKRVAHVAVTVTAPGVAHPSGVVVLGQSGTRVDRATVENGHAMLDTRRLSPGRHVFRVHYLNPRTGSTARSNVVVLVP